MIDRSKTPKAPVPFEPLEPPAEKKYYHDPGGKKAIARTRRIDDLLAAAGGAKGALDWGYWELVYDHEEAPMTTDAEQLRAAGFELPDPSTLDDAQLSAKLESLIDELERMSVYVFDFDHVSERELYEMLVGELLHEERRDIPMREDAGGWMIDISFVRPPEEVDGEE